MGVAPRCQYWILAKVFVAYIVSTYVGCPSIDDHNLAVIAKINPTGQGPQQRVANWQCYGNVDTGITHGRPML